MSGSTSVVELLTLALQALTAAGVLFLAYDLRRLNGKFDRLTGRVDSVETAHNAHVNTPGLHRA